MHQIQFRMWQGKRGKRKEGRGEKGTVAATFLLKAALMIFAYILRIFSDINVHFFINLSFV